MKEKNQQPVKKETTQQDSKTTGNQQSEAGKKVSEEIDRKFGHLAESH